MEQDGVQIGTGYPAGQLAKAVASGSTDRAEKWRAVLSGIFSGRLRIGSRTPVANLPAWVTPEVVHGGFATGKAAASGPLRPAEIAYAERHGLSGGRGEMFQHRLDHDLPSGDLVISVPEQAVLPVIGWLRRAGDDEPALDLIREVRPYSGLLCFTPEPAPGPAAEAGLVWRTTAGEIRAKLASRQPKPAITTMRDTLTVWNLYADRVLALWLSGEIDASFRRRARVLLDEYPRLAAEHPPSRRHAGPKANLTVLRTALEDVLAGREWRRGLVRTVIDAMVRRRGTPGGPEHAALRARQASEAARPPHHLIAHAIADRLTALPQHTGISHPESLVTPVPIEGYGETRAEVPPAIAAVIRRATAAGVEDLVEAGLVPSAEVLAGLVAPVTAQAVGAAYPDPELRALMTAHYLAFRNRRSLLLTNLESQVRPEELPWVRAVAAHRAPSAGLGGTLARLSTLVVRSFPATLIPNPMVRELATLTREAGIDLPWTEELAADIFDGRFVTKFLRAAHLAASLLSNTLYERYYGIDYASIVLLPADGKISPEFARLCRERAGMRSARGRPAENGMVIEQAQILTTHNLATLWEAGAELEPDLAERCFAVADRLSRRLSGPYAHRRVKDVAYAWRQMLFHASLDSAPERFVSRLPVDGPLGPAVLGLREAVDGGSPRPLTGWSTERHWLLS